MILITLIIMSSGLLVGSCGKKDDQSYKIGVITPLTGTRATYGAATKRGVDLAAEKINKQGGVNGVRIDIIYEDSQGEPALATNALQKLINVNNVPVVLGAFRSAETQAIAPIAEKQKVILFSASSTADDIKYAGDYIFRNVPTNSDQGTTAALFVLQFLEKKKAAVLYQNDDYGKSLAEAFIRSFQERGGSVVVKETFESKQRDYKTVLAKVKQKRPEVVFFPGNYEECAIILKQARELRFMEPFVGGDGAYSPQLFEIGGRAVENSYYTLMAMGYGISDDLIEFFRRSFIEKYAEEPDVYSAYAYDAIITIAEAIKQSAYSADSIKGALYRMEFKGITGITRFDSYGEVTKPYYLYQAKKGNFELLRWTPTFAENIHIEMIK